MNIQTSLDNLIFLILLVVTIVYWASLIFPNVKILTKVRFGGMVVTNVLLFSLLSFRWLVNGYFPLSNLYESLMFLAWGLTSTSILIENKARIGLIGSVSSPISLFVVGFAGLSLPENMQAPSPLVPALKSNWLMMHVTVMMLSYAFLIIGSLLGILFLILTSGKNEEIILQGSSFGTNPVAKPLVNTAFYKTSSNNDYSTLITGDSISALKPNNNRISLLESIDNLSYRTISFGFPMLTIGIIAGAVWANEAWGSYWSWDPKETWALITWLVFASYLHARITKSWQGRKPALISALGFIVVWICYLGVNFLGKGLHTYGQIL